jgi:hypothetical protein
MVLYKSPALITPKRKKNIAFAMFFFLFYALCYIQPSPLGVFLYAFGYPFGSV